MAKKRNFPTGSSVRNRFQNRNRLSDSASDSIIDSESIFSPMSLHIKQGIS